MHTCMFRFHFHIASQPMEPTRVSVLSDQSLIRSNQIRLNRNMKQSELGIRMATVGLCGLRFWARCPTETYRCTALLQMAFLFSLTPNSGDRSNDSHSSKPCPDTSLSHELNDTNLKHPKSSSSSSSSLLANVGKHLTEGVKKLSRKSRSSKKKEKVNASTEAKGDTKDVKKLSGKSGSSEKKEKVNASTEAKGNTTIQEEILKLKHMIEIKNEEVNLQVEKLMDLCLNQREEIKSLKSSFPDDTNSQLQELVEKQGSKLKEVKQVIPSLQQQVSSLTSQLQSLAVDLAELI